MPGGNTRTDSRTYLVTHIPLQPRCSKLASCLPWHWTATTPWYHHLLPSNWPIHHRSSFPTGEHENALHHELPAPSHQHRLTLTVWRKKVLGLSSLQWRRDILLMRAQLWCTYLVMVSGDCRHYKNNNMRLVLQQVGTHLRNWNYAEPLDRKLKKKD